MRLPFFCVATLLALSCRADERLNERPVQRGYQTSTLTDPFLDAATVASHTRTLEAWLAVNYARLNADQLKSTREQLYYLIDARVKQLYVSSGRIWPVDHDEVLEHLYAWADRLGVYGGTLIYEALKSPEAPDQPASRALPAEMSVGLTDDLLRLSSAEGWSFTVPYYFMIWDVRDFQSPEGMRTQLVILSTGAADDRSRAGGHSQATLMLIFAPHADDAAFAAAWKERFHVTEDEQRTSVAGRSAYVAYDKDAKLHRELVLWTDERGPFAVAYLGLDGAYQWNRAHFADFLATIRTH